MTLWRIFKIWTCNFGISSKLTLKYFVMTLSNSFCSPTQTKMPSPPPSNYYTFPTLDSVSLTRTRLLLERAWMTRGIKKVGVHWRWGIAPLHLHYILSRTCRLQHSYSFYFGPIKKNTCQSNGEVCGYVHRKMRLQLTELSGDIWVAKLKFEDS